MTSIEVNSGNKVYDSRNNCNAIIETATNKLILGCKSTIIPNSVTSIGYYAFYGCINLTIRCEANDKLSDWNEHWNPNNCVVVWGYKNK